MITSPSRDSLVSYYCVLLLTTTWLVTWVNCQPATVTEHDGSGNNNNNRRSVKDDLQEIREIFASKYIKYKKVNQSVLLSDFRNSLKSVYNHHRTRNKYSSKIKESDLRNIINSKAQQKSSTEFSNENKNDRQPLSIDRFDYEEGLIDDSQIHGRNYWAKEYSSSLTTENYSTEDSEGINSTTEDSDDETTEYYDYVEFNSTESFNESDSNSTDPDGPKRAGWFMKLYKCYRYMNLIHCMKVFMLQRTLAAIEIANNSSENITVTWFEEWMSNPIENDIDMEPYVDMDDEELDAMIVDSLKELFNTTVLAFHFLPGVSVQLQPNSNGTVNLSVKLQDQRVMKIASDSRKMKMSNIMPIVLVPPLLLSAAWPFIFPKLKMAALMVGMINNMAFMSALFSLIRGYIFDPRPEDNIVYVNKGYEGEHKPAQFPHKNMFVLGTSGGVGGQTIRIHEFG